MARNRNILLTLTIESSMVLMASMVTFRLHESVVMPMEVSVFIDGYLTIDISAKVKGIQEQESRREYLTVEELNRLAQTPCDPLLKRAALFSALTGIRHCDIQKLKWSEVEMFNGNYRLNFTQQKTKGVEYMPISEQAFQLCGERQE
jgi:integrase